MRFYKGTTLFFTLCIFWLTAIAQEVQNIQSVSLDSVLVKGYRYSSAIKSNPDGSMIWDMQRMDNLPQILGNADPIHYAQMLPGIQTNAEYTSGIHIQGCDNSHNHITLGGVPIYNVNHLLGFFSTFNSTHFPSLNCCGNLPFFILSNTTCCSCIPFTKGFE